MKYTWNQIASKVDHTLLKQDAKWTEIQKLIEEGAQYSVASVCISPSYVKQARQYAGEKVKICTVIGFPNGCSTTTSKQFEAEDAVNNGADEIDMVINIGWLKDGLEEKLLQEINAVKEACRGRILKVIVETCLLTDEEKKIISRIVSQSNADFIKTSTGFSKGGATLDDIILLKKCCPGKLVKAAGGISTLADAESFLDAGADRLGSSRIISLIKERQANE